ncbi:bacteriohemerythrin [Desulfovibrio sp. Fe33]|uniref:bacteriohemerythrin n=1 Tax=Desulfovibrio sp. Fe33 TaxID=3020842 RepID=UPI00234C67EC|nr:hemerythrin domain-containing protein [Desulfovibrio sp. Fe33]
MNKSKWGKYVIQTASRWEDIEDVVRATGIERIDHDHQRLLEYILAMEESPRADTGRRSTSRLIENQKLTFERFLNTLKRHYETEEAFMSRYALPGREEQLSHHESFLAGSEAIIEDFNSGVLSFYQEMKGEVLPHLIEHINGIDSKTFALDNFLPALMRARSWADISEIIKSTGVPFVDEEHQILTQLIIDLNTYLSETDFEADTQGKKEKTLEMTEGIQDFTKNHFAHEIDFLKRYAIPTDTQDSPHAFFTGEMDRILGRMRRGDFSSMKEVVEFLLSWWVKHINGRDYLDFHFSRLAAPIFKQAETSDDFTWLIRKTGVDQIDSEHAQMINMLMEMPAQKRQDEKSFDPRKALGDLLEFVNLHFAHEEKIMRDMDIRELEIHREAHRRISANIGDGMTHAVLGKALVSPSLCKRLMNWWVSHTNGMDYETFILNRS